jgi:hypothetical protein
MDSWFSSPDLFYKMCSKDWHYGNLVSKQKGVSAEINGAELKKGEHVQSAKTEIDNDNEVEK